MADHWHRRLFEHRSALFAVATTVAISIGGLVEIVPMFTVGSGHLQELPAPYTALEVTGRDIYIREGCVNCHSQMVRPFRDETLRYGGEWSHAVEYSWDRPFLLGSRRIGPDLHREGLLRPSAVWHYRHMQDPRSMSPGSVMPVYDWLITWKVDPADTQATMQALTYVGTPYSEQQIASAAADMQAQAEPILAELAQAGIEAAWDDEIIALTAYLQRLGTDIPTDASVAAGGEL